MAQPFIPVPNTLQVEMVYFTNGGFAENVYHVHGDGAITDVEGLAGSVRDAFHTWETAQMRQLRTQDYGLHHMTVRDMGTQGGFALFDGTVILGTGPVGAAPDSVTLAVKWSTHRAGRSFRGRTYHIGVPQSVVTRDALDGTYVTNLVAGYQALIPAISGIFGVATPGQAGELCVVSKRQNKAWLATGVTTPIVSAGVVDNFIDCQRRRLKGRGS